MYQYMSEDMSALKRFRLDKNPFTGKPVSSSVVKKTSPPSYPPLAQPAQATPAQPGASLSLIKSGGVTDVAAAPAAPERPAAAEAPASVPEAAGGEYPKPPEGFSARPTRHFVVYEEGPEVSDEVADTLENLHGSIMLDLVAFSPWTREKKVYIYFAHSVDTYRKLTGRPAWSGGAASLSERKIYVYKSDEAYGILSHELTHIYFDSFFPAGNPSPLWLSEGIATYVQSERGLSTPVWLSQNLQKLEGGQGFKLGDLVRIDNLQGADEENVRLWYAQSYSVVRFMMKLKAGDAFYVFCKELRDGRPANQALYRAYGMPYNKFSALEYAWRYDLKTGKISNVNR